MKKYTKYNQRLITVFDNTDESKLDYKQPGKQKIILL